MTRAGEGARTPEGTALAGGEVLRLLLAMFLEAVPGCLGAAVTVAHAEGEHRLAVAGSLGEEPPGAGADVVRALVTVPLGAGVLTLYLDRPERPGDAEAAGRPAAALASALALAERCAVETARADQMVQMMEYRRVIEQAKGMVMAATGAGADAAFATLARGSQHFNVRLRNLAVALVELVGGAPAERPGDPGAVVTPSAHEREAAERVWAALSVPPRAGAGGHA